MIGEIDRPDLQTYRAVSVKRNLYTFINFDLNIADRQRAGYLTDRYIDIDIIKDINLHTMYCTLHPNIILHLKSKHEILSIHVLIIE